jgi:hypothetical protein
MSDIGKVRLRVPSTIKPGEVVRARALVIHPMERIERDKQGRVIEKNYNYITPVVVMYLGKTVATFETTQNVSEPSFVRLQGADLGAQVVFTDTVGGRPRAPRDIVLGDGERPPWLGAVVPRSAAPRQR